jgi:ribosome modulation factor
MKGFTFVTRAEKAGYRAYIEGGKNPYKPGTVAYNDFKDGWNEAMEDVRNNEPGDKRYHVAWQNPQRDD